MRALGHVRVFLHSFAIGVQWLNCIPLSDSFRHTSTFYKKSQVLCLLPPGFAAIRINFIAASKKNAPSRGESLWAVRSSFLLFKFFYLSNQAAQTVETAVHSGAPPHAAPYSACRHGAFRSCRKQKIRQRRARFLFSALFKAAIQSGLNLKPFTKKHLRRLPGSTGAFFAFRIYKSHSAAGLSSTPLTALQAFSRWVRPVPAVRSPPGNRPHRTECTG